MNWLADMFSELSQAMTELVLFSCTVFRPC
jgi:hypothetical protein